MIEKFTPEEIAQIKRELRFAGTENSVTKSIVLLPFRDEIGEVFPETVIKRNPGFYSSEKRKVMNALTTLCDFSLENYCIDTEDDIERFSINRDIKTDLQGKYKKMMCELLEVCRKYKNQED